MTLQKGDFLLINYNAKVKETNEVFDTTNDDVAKKEHLKKEGEIYEPKLIVIGEGWLLKPLDEALTTMEVGKEATVEIPADKGFGARDPEKIKRVHLRQLLEKEINPTLGARIEYQGKMATVRSIGAGRVLLDFNPPLAGRTLIYDVTPIKKLESKEEKITELIHRRIPPVEQDKFKLTIDGQILNIDMPEDTFYVEGIQIAKRGIAMDIQKFIADIAEIKFIETFKSEPKPAAAVPAAAPAPEPAATPVAEPTPEPKTKPKAKAKAKATEE